IRHRLVQEEIAGKQPHAHPAEEQLGRSKSREGSGSIHHFGSNLTLRFLLCVTSVKSRRFKALSGIPVGPVGVCHESWHIACRKSASNRSAQTLRNCFR